MLDFVRIIRFDRILIGGTLPCHLYFGMSVVMKHYFWRNVSVSSIFAWIFRFSAIRFGPMDNFWALWLFIYSAILIRPNVPARFVFLGNGSLNQNNFFGTIEVCSSQNYCFPSESNSNHLLNWLEIGLIKH